MPRGAFPDGKFLNYTRIILKNVKLEKGIRLIIAIERDETIIMYVDHALASIG